MCNVFKVKNSICMCFLEIETFMSSLNFLKQKLFKSDNADYVQCIKVIKSFWNIFFLSHRDAYANLCFWNKIDNKPYFQCNQKVIKSFLIRFASHRHVFLGDRDAYAKFKLLKQKWFKEIIWFCTDFLAIRDAYRVIDTLMPSYQIWKSCFKMTKCWLYVQCIQKS